MPWRYLSPLPGPPSEWSTLWRHDPPVNVTPEWCYAAATRGSRIGRLKAAATSPEAAVAMKPMS